MVSCDFLLSVRIILQLEPVKILRLYTLYGKFREIRHRTWIRTCLSVKLIKINIPRVFSLCTDISLECCFCIPYKTKTSYFSFCSVFYCWIEECSNLEITLWIIVGNPRPVWHTFTECVYWNARLVVDFQRYRWYIKKIVKLHSFHFHKHYMYYTAIIFLNLKENFVYLLLNRGADGWRIPHQLRVVFFLI